MARIDTQKTTARGLYEPHFEARADAQARPFRPLAGLMGALAAAIGGLVERVRAAHERRIALARLRSLDDYLLADIGIRRGEIELAVEGGIDRRRPGNDNRPHLAA